MLKVWKVAAFCIAAEGAALLAVALAACGLWSAFVGPTKRPARADRLAMEAGRKFIVGADLRTSQDLRLLAASWQFLEDSGGCLCCQGGNWKANGSPDSVKKLVQDLNDGDITSKDSKPCLVSAHNRNPHPDILAGRGGRVRSTFRFPFRGLAFASSWALEACLGGSDHFRLPGAGQPAQGLQRGSAESLGQGSWRVDRQHATLAGSVQSIHVDSARSAGEIPAQMLADMGIKWVVLGHSERRENCGETSQIARHQVALLSDREARRFLAR